jgi:hypothetical protein
MMNDVSSVRPVADLHLLGLLAGGKKCEAVEYLDAMGEVRGMNRLGRHLTLGLIDDCMNLTADGRAVLEYEDSKGGEA